MSGGYTHITLAQLAVEEVRNRREGLLHNDAKKALGYWKKFCIIGAVAPDYPYLDLLGSNSSAWADAMHKGHALAFLRDGVIKIRDMTDDHVRQKCMAWLFGFAAHVATDGTIHPVVNLKVGPYEQNKTEHRRCEMSQDVCAHSLLNMGALDFNRQISTNVDDTSDAWDRDRVDSDVAQLWRDLLIGIYASRDSRLGPPKVHAWHGAMRRMMKYSLVVTLLLGACAAPIAAVPDAKERGQLSTKMVNLSSAVDTYFADLPEAPIDSDGNILQTATRHDPRLLPPELQGYVLKVQYQNPYAVLLLCSKDGKRTIMEDAGCSARLDRQVTQTAPCEFTLHVTQNCRVEGADSQ
jgi:hypothetical protein